MKKACFALIIGLFLLAYTHAFAQVGTTTANRGLIKGKVTDTAMPRPNNLPHVVITVESELLLGTESRTAKTDQAGNYAILDLPPGEYLVTATRAEYHDRKDYVTLGPGDEVFHNIKLRKKDTLMTYFWKMGPHRWRLVLCLSVLPFPAIFAVVSAIHITNRIRRLGESKSEINEAFISRVTEALRDDDVPGAISACDDVGGLADILKVGLLKYAELGGKGEADDEEVQKAIEEAGVTAKRELKYHWWLFAMFGVIGGAALLYGFWGTAQGAARVRAVIAARAPGQQYQLSDSQLLAGGMSEAMLTTWFGLAIAVLSAGLCLIAFIVHMIFKRRADALVSETQQIFTGVVDSLFAPETSGNTDQ